MILVLLLIVSAVMKTNAQVTIGNDTPPAATLDVVATKSDGSTAEGIIAPRVTLAQLNAAYSKYGAAQTGAIVYVTDYSGATISGYSDQITCRGYAYFNGIYWVGDCAATQSYARILFQPKAFTFYELGTETETPLDFGAGGSSTMTYQWYIVTGSNIHVRIARPCIASDGTGFNSSSFTPRVAGGLNSTDTKTASKNGFYRYYCVATNMEGDFVTSDIAEVAVGCGAKDLNGEWISFMCFNLGATRHTIAAQQNTPITFPVANQNDGRHVKAAGEELTYGDLFQWGRIADGHEKRNVISVGSEGGTDNAVAWNATTPPTYADGNVLGTSQRYPYQQVPVTNTTYYGKFIRTIASNAYNWYAGSNHQSIAVDQLWRQSAFAPNDPCQKIMDDGVTYSNWYPPASSSTAGGSSGTGWRTPTQHEWASLYRGGTSSGSSVIALANTWVWYQLNSANTEGAKGMALKPDGVITTLFLPASGNRGSTNAVLYAQGANGRYWSGSIMGTSAYYLNFASNIIAPASSDYRGVGFALRCIKN